MFKKLLDKWHRFLYQRKVKKQRKKLASDEKYKHIYPLF